MALSDAKEPSTIADDVADLLDDSGLPEVGAKLLAEGCLSELAAYDTKNATEAMKAQIKSALGRKEAILARQAGTDLLLSQVRSTTFSASSLPVQASGDALSFDVTIRRRAGLPDQILTSRALDRKPFMTVEVTGGTHLDVAPGVMFSSVRDKSYAIVDGKIREHGEHDRARAVPSTMIHFYRRNSPGFAWGGSFGVGLAEGKSAHYFLGTSLIFGKQRRGVVSAGVSAGYRKVLGDGLEAGDAPPDTSNVNLRIPTVDRLGFGAFFGFSVNL